MRRVAYAVCKQSGLPYQFSKWHDKKEDAIAEAERLCKLENKTFVILKLVGYCETVENPINTQQWD